MNIFILQRDEKGKFIKWAECDNLTSLYEFAQYFANNIYCKDFIIYIDHNNGSDQPRAMSMTAYCDRQGIPLKWDRNEKGELIKI